MHGTVAMDGFGVDCLTTGPEVVGTIHASQHTSIYSVECLRDGDR